MRTVVGTILMLLMIFPISVIAMCIREIGKEIEKL